ncbi:diadenosine tetraphosphatase [Dehalogenimonas sp. WBC-2]|nr:diadenosine tetraphosphatase [Dehalogenimonas sp. WBC-2]
MRYAIIADIHANLEALTAVVADIESRGQIDEYWVLGDITGYGSDPRACIEIVKNLSDTVVAGNHDLAAVRRHTGQSFNFNADAAAAVHWTETQLTAEDITYLHSLPLTIERRGFTLVHGSPCQPDREYVSSVHVAHQNFSQLKTPHAMVGHTHQPAIFKQEDDGGTVYLPFHPGAGVMLQKGRFIINPGSVGQPRDGDPRASYTVYDSDTACIRLFRVDYDIAATQAKIKSQNLPLYLATRLEKGL